MEEALKKRLIGAATLVALAVIFIPPLIEQGSVDEPVEIPEVPAIPGDLKQDFSSNSIEKPIAAPQIPEHILNPPVEPEPEPEPEPNQSQPEQPEIAVDTAQSAEKQPTNKVIPTPAEPSESQHVVDQPKDIKPAKPATVVEKSPSVQPKTDPNLQAWVIQVASFSQAQNAQKLVKRLRSAGYQVPDLAPVKINNKAYYRVKVGPMLERSAAEKLLPKINALSGSKGRIVAHRP